MLNRLGVQVHHEGVGLHGAVSWLDAYNARSYIINNPERLRRQRFRLIFHQVTLQRLVLVLVLVVCVQ